MPKGNEKYSLGKIYKIISNNPEITEVYYGSTAQRLLCSRLSKHRSSYKRWLVGKGGLCTVYNLFEKYGIEQFHIELVEDFPCENKYQLFARENHFIRNFNCVNKQSAPSNIPRKEYEEKYRLENKEQISNRNKKPVTCECGCKISFRNISTHRKSKKHKSLMCVSI